MNTFNFATMIGLTNDDRCLIYNLCVENENMVKEMSTFKLCIINSKCYLVFDSLYGNRLT